ncbi:hypothetical protein C8R44DRAFT_751357 [Mycena epipterygia]|nr:hypothetical protein C8R44DRAFT_751357 [Mycena epipterygia]
MSHSSYMCGSLGYPNEVAICVGVDAVIDVAKAWLDNLFLPSLSLNLSRSAHSLIVPPKVLTISEAQKTEPSSSQTPTIDTTVQHIEGADRSEQRKLRDIFALLSAIGIPGVSAAQVGLILTYGSKLFSSSRSTVHGPQETFRRDRARGDTVHQEATHESDSQFKLPAEGPAQGAIEFKDVSMAYRPCTLKIKSWLFPEGNLAIFRSPFKNKEGGKFFTFLMGKSEDFNSRNLLEKSGSFPFHFTVWENPGSENASAKSVAVVSAVITMIENPGMRSLPRPVSGFLEDLGLERSGLRQPTPLYDNVPALRGVPCGTHHWFTARVTQVPRPMSPCDWKIVSHKTKESNRVYGTRSAQLPSDTVHRYWHGSR